MIKRLLIVTAGVLLFWAAPASAQYADAVTVEVADSSLAAGASTEVSGICEGADEVSITFRGEDIGTSSVGDDGTYAGTLTIGDDTPPGDYDLTTTCGDQVATTVITVTAAGGNGDNGTDNGGKGDEGTDNGGVQTGLADEGGTSGGTGTLARTGSSSDMLFKVAGGLIVVGGAAMLITSKRRRLGTS